MSHVSHEMRDLLVVAHLPLVKHISRAFRVKAREKRVDLDDLVQQGNLALVKAADAWNPDRARCQFATYAGQWIRGELMKMLSKTPLPTLSEFATIADPRPQLTLEPLSPITSLTPSSECPHRGPIGKESVFVCIICHECGRPNHPALRRDPATDPRPESKPKAPPPAPKKRETRRVRRKRIFAPSPLVA